MEIKSLPEVKYYPSNNDINWLVRKFETIKSNQKNIKLVDNFIPRPDVALVFNFKGIPEVLSPDNIQLKRLFIATIPVRPLQLLLKNEINSFIVVCNPTILSKILKINLKNEIPVVEIFDDRFMDLWENLSLKNNDFERIKYFSEFVTHIVSGKYEPDMIDRIYVDIIDNCTNKSIKQLTEKSYLSMSSLQRCFLKRTGISMKKMIRIARVHTIFKLMLKEQQFDCKSILYESCYYDQSHFIRDFKEITGLSPKKFFKNNSEVLRMFSGMESIS